MGSFQVKCCDGIKGNEEEGNTTHHPCSHFGPLDPGVKSVCGLLFSSRWSSWSNEVGR